MNPLLLLTIIGSVASLVSLLISAPNLKSRIIHLIYAVVLTVLTGCSFLFINNIEIENTKLSSEVMKYENTSKNAERILRTYDNTSDVGTNRGFILTSFAFLEKNKAQFPETYNLAKELITDGILVTKSAPDRDLDEKWNEEKRMKDGSQTMQSLLKGIVNK